MKSFPNKRKTETKSFRCMHAHFVLYDTQKQQRIQNQFPKFCTELFLCRIVENLNFRGLNLGFRMTWMRACMRMVRSSEQIQWHSCNRSFCHNKPQCSDAGSGLIWFFQLISRKFQSNAWTDILLVCISAIIGLKNISEIQSSLVKSFGIIFYFVESF